jgi:hypothetical protein
MEKRNGNEFAEAVTALGLVLTVITFLSTAKRHLAPTSPFISIHHLFAFVSIFDILIVFFM